MNRRSDVPVDVAWGANNRLIGAGNRPTGFLEEGDVTIFVLSTTSRTAERFARAIYGTARIGVDEIGTHTEPSVGYDETSNRYFVAYTAEDSSVRVLSLDDNGEPTIVGAGGSCPCGAGLTCVASTCQAKSCTDNSQCGGGSLMCGANDTCIVGPFDTGYDSLLPPRIACDSHSPSVLGECKIYIQPTSSSSSVESGAFISDSLAFVGNGELAIVRFPRLSGSFFTFLGDAGTFGRNRLSGQGSTSSAWWVNASPFSSSSPTSENRFLFDDAGIFNASIDPYVGTYVNIQSYQTSGMRTATTSFDWNEAISRFVMVSAE